MPALITRPSIAAPDCRAFCTSRLPPTCSFHRYGIEEQRVELIGAAGLEQAGQLLDAVGEDFFGDLPAAGQLGPVPGVGGGGDDLGVDRGRGHARQQDRRPSGQPGELRRELDPAVGEADHGRGVGRPGAGHLGDGPDGEEIALTAAGCRGHDADTEAADHRRGQPGQDVAGTQVENPSRPGLVNARDLVHPVDAVHQDGLGQLPGQRDIEAYLLGPASDDVDAVGQPRRVEAHLDLHRIEDRREDVAAADLVLTVGLFLLGDLLAIQFETRELLGGAGDDDRSPAVADGQHRRQHGANILRELVEQPANALGIGVGHRHHRRAVAEHGDAAPAGHQRPGRADQLGQRQQLDVARARGLERLDGEHALRMPGDGHRRRRAPVHALPRQGTRGRDLCEQHAGYRHRGRRQVLVRRDRIFGCQRTHPPQRLETDRTHHDQLFCHRLEQQLHLTDQRCQVGFDPGRRHQFFEGLQPGAPWPPNATAYGSPVVRRSTRAWVSCGPVPSRSADTRSCSSIVTCISLYASLRIGSFGRSAPGPGAFSSQSIPRRITAESGWPVCCRRTARSVERRGGLHRLY